MFSFKFQTIFTKQRYYLNYKISTGLIILTPWHCNVFQG